jgi:Tol biopolymer transport system component
VINLGVTCNPDGTATFNIVNNAGPMPSPGTYTISVPGQNSVTQSFQLGAGQSLSFVDAGNAVVVVQYSTSVLASVTLSVVGNCLLPPTATPTNTPTSTPTNTPTSTLTPPELTVSEQCDQQSGKEIYTVTNTGRAMTTAAKWTASDGKSGTLKLGAGKSVSIRVQPDTSGHTDLSVQGFANASGSAGNCIVDLCPNIQGIQQTIPAGMARDSQGNCTPDKCPNIGGVQNAVPNGMVKDDKGNCVTDQCPNIGGIQESIPGGMVQDVAGNCVYDQCPNIEGVQGSIPGGMVQDQNGNCVVDQCLNLEGVQGAVPGGMVRDANGNCLVDQCLNLEGIQESVPRGMIQDANSNCWVDQCLNMSGIQLSVPDGMVRDTNGNCVVDQCPNLEGIQASVPGGMIQDANGNCLPPKSVCGVTTATGPHGFPVVDMNPADCTATQATPPPWTPIQVGAAVCPDWFVYHTDQTGNWEIFRLGELPGEPGADANISHGPGQDVFNVAPSRSPDAQWVAFASNRDGNWEIYIGTPDGKEQRRVTYSTDATDIDPMWSPTGRYVAYESARDGNWEIYMVDMTTGAETRLTDNPAYDVNPFWSPDGTQIAFQSDRDGQWQIYVLDVATRQATRVSDLQGNDYDPQFSFDGKMIAFHSIRGSNPNNVVYIMNADGSNVQPISDPAGDADNQVWSPDNKLIAYQSNLNGDNDIYVYELATGNTRLVTNNTIEDYAPTWFCNSPILIFTSDITGDANLFSTPALPMDASAIQVAKEASQLTTEPHSDLFPESVPREENASREGSTPAHATTG